MLYLLILSILGEVVRCMQSQSQSLSCFLMGMHISPLYTFIYIYISYY